MYQQQNFSRLSEKNQFYIQQRMARYYQPIGIQTQQKHQQLQSTIGSRLKQIFQSAYQFLKLPFVNTKSHNQQQSQLPQLQQQQQFQSIQYPELQNNNNQKDKPINQQQTHQNGFTFTNLNKQRDLPQRIQPGKITVKSESDQLEKEQSQSQQELSSQKNYQKFGEDTQQYVKQKESFKNMKIYNQIKRYDNRLKLKDYIKQLSLQLKSGNKDLVKPIPKQLNCNSHAHEFQRNQNEKLKLNGSILKQPIQKIKLSSFENQYKNYLNEHDIDLWEDQNSMDLEYQQLRGFKRTKYAKNKFVYLPKKTQKNILKQPQQKRLTIQQGSESEEITPPYIDNSTKDQTNFSFAHPTQSNNPSENKKPSKVQITLKNPFQRDKYIMQFFQDECLELPQLQKINIKFPEQEKISMNNNKKYNQQIPNKNSRIPLQNQFSINDQFISQGIPTESNQDQSLKKISEQKQHQPLQTPPNDYHLVKQIQTNNSSDKATSPITKDQLLMFTSNSIINQLINDNDYSSSSQNQSTQKQIHFDFLEDKLQQQVQNNKTNTPPNEQTKSTNSDFQEKYMKDSTCKNNIQKDADQLNMYKQSNDKNSLLQYDKYDQSVQDNPESPENLRQTNQKSENHQIAENPFLSNKISCMQLQQLITNSLNLFNNNVSTNNINNQQEFNNQPNPTNIFNNQVLQFSQNEEQNPSTSNLQKYQDSPSPLSTIQQFQLCNNQDAISKNIFSNIVDTWNINNHSNKNHDDNNTTKNQQNFTQSQYFDDQSTINTKLPNQQQIFEFRNNNSLQKNESCLGNLFDQFHQTNMFTNNSFSFFDNQNKENSNIFKTYQHQHQHQEQEQEIPRFFNNEILKPENNIFIQNTNPKFPNQNPQDNFQSSLFSNFTSSFFGTQNSCDINKLPVNNQNQAMLDYNQLLKQRQKLKIKGIKGADIRINDI